MVINSNLWTFEEFPNDIIPQDTSIILKKHLETLFAYKYLSIKIFSELLNKNIMFLTTLHFIGFFLLIKKKILEMYLQKEFTKHIFFESMHGLYSQFSFFCIIVYIVFQFKHNPLKCTYGLFLHSVVWGNNI